jgi:membrane protease YdiL (CAAX protease family)
MHETDSIPSTQRQSQTDRIISRAWNAPEVGILLGTLLLFHFLFSLIASLCPKESLPFVQLCATLLIYAIVTGTLLFILRSRRVSWRESYGMGARQLPLLALSPVLYLVMLPFLMLSAAVWHVLLRQIAGLDIEVQHVVQIILDAPLWMRVLYITMAIIITPVYEEVLFRGTLFPFLLKQGGELKGTLMVSALFAALHFHLPSFFPLIILSAALCIAYKRTGSLWICIGAHAIFNAISILALFLL